MVNCAFEVLVLLLKKYLRGSMRKIFIVGDPIIVSKYEPIAIKNGGGYSLQSPRLFPQDILTTLKTSKSKEFLAFDDQKSAESYSASSVRKAEGTKQDMKCTSRPIFCIEIRPSAIPSVRDNQKFISHDDILKVFSVYLDRGQTSAYVHQELKENYPYPNFINRFEEAWEKYATQKSNPIDIFNAVAQELRNSLPRPKGCWPFRYCFFDSTRVIRAKLDALTSAASTKSIEAVVGVLVAQQTNLDLQLIDYNDFLTSAIKHLVKPKVLIRARGSISAVQTSVTQEAIAPTFSLQAQP